MVQSKSLTDFQALSFDCYGTLIDWETGLKEGLQPLIAQLPSDHPYARDYNKITARLDELAHNLQVKQPTLPYNEILASSYGVIAKEEGIRATEEEKAKFGNSVGSWKAFPDTVEGLRILKKYYKLIILSNVDNGNIKRTLAGPLGGVKFDAAYTAQDIGSFKPDHQNFAYLFEHVKSEFGLEKDQLLHTAKSLPADHVPAKELGLTSAWIARGLDGVSIAGGDLRHFDGRVAFTWRFPSIGAMAEEVERAFSKK